MYHDIVYRVSLLIRKLVLLAALAPTLAGCHLIYPFAATAADGGGPNGDGHLADRSLTNDRLLNDQLSASDRLDLGPASDRGDQQRPSCLPGAKLVLSQVSSTLLTAAMPAFNASCKTGNNLSAVTPYTLSACPANPQLDQVLSGVLARTQSYITAQNGGARTPAELQNTFFFETSPCKGGPQLLAVIKTYCGNTTLVGWYGEVEVRCQNCTQYVALALLYCPAVNKAVLLEGTYGWDS